MKKSFMSKNGPVRVEYSTSLNGDYTPFIRVRPCESLSLHELASKCRRHLLLSPSFILEHIPDVIVKWTARFWFRIPSNGHYIYFTVLISSSDINSISSRGAAL